MSSSIFSFGVVTQCEFLFFSFLLFIALYKQVWGYRNKTSDFFKCSYFKT